MTRSKPKSRVYKDSSAQQLRSFCETARLGSISAAATHLGLSNPTVWHQIRAMEREYGDQFIEAHGRGSRLTSAGKVLAELATPIVASLASLKQQYMEKQGRQYHRLSIATTPRIFLEHLPECVCKFRSQFPDSPILLKEAYDAQVHSMVENGEVEIGIVQGRGVPLSNPSTCDWLEIEALYQLDVVLIMLKDHPLAKKRNILPKDLGDYPLVNVPRSLLDPEAVAILETARSKQSHSQVVEAFFNSSIYRYVELGFGIALVVAIPGRAKVSKFHEHVMNRYFGRPTVYQLRRKGAVVTPSATAFTTIVKEQLNHPSNK